MRIIQEEAKKIALAQDRIEIYLCVIDKHIEFAILNGNMQCAVPNPNGSKPTDEEAKSIKANYVARGFKWIGANEKIQGEQVNPFNCISWKDDVDIYDYSIHIIREEPTTQDHVKIEHISEFAEPNNEIFITYRSNIKEHTKEYKKLAKILKKIGKLKLKIIVE